MPTTTDGEAKGCTFQWKIQSLCHWWWEMKGEGIESPVFIADALGKTKWKLWLFPMEEINENNIGIYLQRGEDCSGPDIIEVIYQFAFLGKDGSILKEKATLANEFSKGDNWGFVGFEGRERVFVTEREAFLPEDTLNVQCTLWITNPKPDKSNHLFATTVIKVKRRYFVWRIDKPSNLESDIRSRFGDYLIRCNLFLLKNLDRLSIHLSSLDENIRYISCNISIIDSEERRENCGIQKYFVDDLKKAPLYFILANFSEMWNENKGKYFPNDVLSLDFEFVLLTIEHSNCRENSLQLENEVFGNNKYQNTAVLTDDLYSLYNDGMFSDMELRTSTKTFKVHQNILSARSPVFRGMFSQDMKEKNSGYVEIPDFDEDTIHRMLLHIYTDSLEDLQFESASKLYKIADKYRILALKSGCSSFLRDNLCPTNACEILVLAHLYNDDYLQRAVQDHILRHSKQIFCSQEWKGLMRTHLELAAGVMYKKLTKSDLYLPTKRSVSH